jgi:hypothetical protein
MTAKYGKSTLALYGDTIEGEGPILPSFCPHEVASKGADSCHAPAPFPASVGAPPPYRSLAPAARTGSALIQDTSARSPGFGSVGALRKTVLWYSNSLLFGRALSRVSRLRARFSEKAKPRGRWDRRIECE